MSDNKDKDMSMNDEDWTNRISKIQDYMKEQKELAKTDEDVADSFDIMKMNIKRGAKRANMRKKYWSSILLEGRNLPHWPIQKGKESSLPQNVQDSLKTMGEAVSEAYTSFWNDNAIIQQITVVSDRNKQKGGQVYTDASEFAKGRVLAVRQRYTKYFNDGRWNGNYDSEEGMTISLPPADETTPTEATTENEPAGDSDATV